MTGASDATQKLETRTDILAQLREVRSTSERICDPLHPEDQVVQTMPDASPPKWHLAHTTWFFEKMILRAAFPVYKSFHPRYDELFNSYYLSLGQPFERSRRGTLSRPTVREVSLYRAYVDQALSELLSDLPEEPWLAIKPLLVLGIQHEQQHQELLYTDIKHILGCHPLRPLYHPEAERFSTVQSAVWRCIPAGVYAVGNEGALFCFDNETPRHKTYLEKFEISSALVSQGDWLEFIEAGGYERPEFWLSEGWVKSREGRWTAPLYWERRDGAWWRYALSGMKRIDEREPVSHVSYFEADAFARWKGARLPTEQEWEVASAQGLLDQSFGSVWQWTGSSYSAYPGFEKWEGLVGEYNAKFMCNQMVLRGGSLATPEGHSRSTYRNFFGPECRWQFSGVRLARSAK